MIASKALNTVQEWGDRYALIGPYNPSTAAVEFEPLIPSDFSKRVINACKEKHGITVHFGRWLVKGYPRVFLIDTRTAYDQLPKWRSELQPGFANEFDAEANEAIVFGYCVAEFFGQLTYLAEGKRKFIAHFHEWLGSVGLIVMKRWNLPVATVFTTHATLLGRYLSAGGVDLQAVINGSIQLNTDKEAGDRQIYNRFWIEVGACRGADVFTTVSDVTDAEALKMLGRAADVITPNGLNTDRFVAIHEFQNLHKKASFPIHTHSFLLPLHHHLSL